MRLPIARMTVCLCFVSFPAWADCQKIEKAMIAVEEASGVRQKMFPGKAQGESLQFESLKLGDAIYLRQGDQEKWRRVPLDAAQRKDKAEKMLKLLPLSDCVGPRSATDGAVAVQAYDYSQPNPLAGNAKTRSSLWLDADGRVRRLVLEDGSYQTFEYGDFEAPAAEPSRRGKAK